MSVRGSIGTDWLRRAARIEVTDDLLRSWRDYLEEEIKRVHGLSADFTIGDRTRFTLPSDSSHTVVEIESFARRALDAFLNQREQRM